MLLQEKRAVYAAIEGNAHSIPYNKLYKAITGNVEAAILLQVAAQKFMSNDAKPFCLDYDRAKETEQEAWIKETGFSLEEIENAFATIGTEVHSKSEKDAALSSHDKRTLIVFGKDRNGVTWYEINRKLFSSLMVKTIL